MLTLPSSVRINVAAEPVDLRRGFDGLAAATRSVIGANPMSGHVFVFVEPAPEPGEAFGLGPHGLPAIVQASGAGDVQNPDGTRGGATSRRGGCRGTRSDA